MSVQALNGDSYQGAGVGANVQSQVGTSQRLVRYLRNPYISTLAVM